MSRLPGPAARMAAAAFRTSTPQETAMDMLEPGRFGYAVNFKKRYGNYIGGEWVPPM